MSASLTGCRILVVEDEYCIADDLAATLRKVGAEIIGPLATVGDATKSVEQEQIDAALLDINLQGEMVFPVADMLVARGVPFAFATGYDEDVIPLRFAGVPRVLKPCADEHIIEVVVGLTTE
jgi:CheY-like chemotaxis protein